MDRRLAGRRAAAAPKGCAGSLAASTSGGASSRSRCARRRSTAPGQRELRAAEPLDEVAAAADTERLELRTSESYSAAKPPWTPSASTSSRVRMP